uniref:Dystonin n=1 Tax=Sinocyclocheilus rhinocerous TaxID=307959 RepID=A0A673M9J7_9TELE
MIAAAFLVLLRPLSIQCVLLLLLLLVGTVATILFLSCWHRKLRTEKIPIKSVFTRRSRSREAGFRPHHFRSEVCRHSPRHARRSARARVSEEKPLIESEPDSNLRKRRVKKRVQPDFYHSVQLTPTRKSSGSGNASLRCSMSSSADFSDDEEYSVKSGSVSPAPGDTLPWNLPRHERSKRKIQGGSVLDPAERAVLRIADERDRVQKKTFTKWVNQHLLKVRKHVNDLYEDLRDGHNLISLLEVLSGDTLPRERDFLKTLRLVSAADACRVERHGRDHDDDDDDDDKDKGPREKGRMRFHRLQNVQIALDYLKRRQVKLVNIRNDDITDGNPKLTLGLIWTIILHFQISDIHVTGESEDMTAKERLLLWSQQMTEGYVGVRCGNFTTSWRDGRLFNAIIHKYRPDLVDMSRVSTQSSRSNLEQAFGVAEQLGVARLLDPEDVDVSSPDEKSVITYVSTLYDVFPKVPEGMEGISANDVDIKWVEYQNMVKYLSQWIKHNVTVMSDRNFPSNPVELKALYTQYLLFKENEIPPKENEKAKIKHLYKMLEVWIEFGRIQLPQGYHPNDVEKEWGKLIVAMLEREKSLRPEVDRLEMLQQIANRVQRDCVAGEDKLVLARTALQSDAKRLESGIQFQNEAEIAGYLLECENLLRQQVLDIQLLLDGKFYLADQLVQRVSKLRDDLLALRTECSTVYSKARTLTSEQTKMMISGITQSLNSNFSPNFSAGLSPALTHGGLVTSGGSPAMSPAMTPSMQPASVQTYLSGRGGGGGGGMEPGVLQQLKHMQIRKPMLKSSFLDPSLTEDEVNVKFVQDLLNWVEEMQVQLDQAEWGSDLPSVESNLGNHKDFHKAIEEFQMSIKEAKMSEIQMTQPLKQSYSEKLNKLESQYGRLLRQKHLDSLYDFVSRATQELIWLNEKEEEEVAFDWSERNSNISRKRDYHADLMRELDDKEEVIKTVQEKAESLLLENHPARLTIEAYRAAMQTQWSWILQLCHCVEQHLKENAVYFDFFSDAKESLDYLRSLQDAIHRKYSCDRNSSLHRLEDLIQESMDEKEQLLKYSSTVGGLVGRAKSVVQLKARNPENPIRTSLPVKSICDYRQIEITISKEDECVLVSNSHRAKWKVISPSGNEAMVPSVCFSVPPPNKEATEMASRIEQLYQNALALWHHSHINMKSVVSWHYLMTDIRTIRKSTVASIKTLLPGDHEQVLSSLQSHFEDFLRDSDESEVFTVADCAQLEKEVLTCKEYYEELLKSAEREEHEESVYNLFISEVRNFRMRVEGHEEQLIRKIRTPLDRDDLQECVLRITEQEKKKVELDRLKDDLETLREKCEVFLRQAASSPSVPTLSSELNILTQSTNQVYSMCCIYLEKLKTVSLVVKHSQSAEALVKLYEAKLCEEDTINANIKSIDGVMSTLKQWRSEIDERREVFHDLEDELQKARVVSERMFKTHNERDFDLDWHKEKADQLKERWQNIHSQIENRLRDLEGISKSLKYYKDTYNSLDEWSKEMETKQLKAQENQPEDSKALAEFLNQQKVLVAEIEQKQSKIEECQKYSEQYAVGVKDYELQLMTYRAMVDSQHKSPVKRRKMQSSSDVIQQEFMDLRTRYTALVTLMTQYVKFAGETLKRAEEDEVGHLLTFSLCLIIFITNIAMEMYLVIMFEHAFRNILISVISFQALQVIQGILDVESGAVMSVCCSVNNGLIDQNTGVGLLEAQLITTGLIWPEQHLYMDLEDAFKNRLVDDAMCKQLQELNEAKKCLQNLQFALEPLPVITALENGAISEQTAIKIIEIQLATGGLRPTYTGDILHLERAFQLGLIPESLFIQILERKDSWKNLIDPNTAEKVTLSQLMQSSIVHKLTGLCLLPVKRGKDGNISLMTGREISIMKAMHEGIIDRETMFRLLSTQLFAGGIVDPKTGRKLTVEEALSEGLIDQDTASEILSHQAQNGGIVNPCNRSRLTVDEAVQCDLISSSSALLVLERQKAFMGLLWPNAGEILSFSTSLQQNMITGKLASELLRNRHKITALYIPETSEVVDIDSAVENNLVETFTKELLKTIEIPDVFPDIDELNNRFSSWLVMRELQIDGSCSAGEEISDENSTDAPSPSEAKQLFISYLMMNSYMDPKSGQRLLIFDWQLNKMAKLLFETSESEHVDETSGLHMKVSEESQMNNNISDNDNACLNADYSALGELQICKPLESTMEKEHGVVNSTALHNCLKPTLPSESIAALPDLLTADLSVAEQLLNSADELVPTQIHQDLATVYVDLQNAFTDVCHLSAERNNAILLAIETVKVSKEKDLSGTRQLLEDAAFDIQNFISEHAQFLSPTDSRHLLRALSTTQRSFKELMDRVFTQRQALEIQLEICEDETQQEFSEKLQELFDDLTQTENRLIGHQQQAASAKTVGDLQQYQQEHQKDLQANASALNEVISSTKKFLEENRSKLTPEQISALENKLEELKSKANMLNQKAEESRKDLEQVLTSAIKQETEKEAAVEQLEESKTKIEGLLGWISNIGKEKEMGGIQKDQMVKQNGNMPEYTSMKGIIGEEDDPNGNALDTTDNTSLHAGEKQDGKDLDLDQQFNRVQAHHQEILSQQQDLIIATQSAQALLDKQAQVLSPAEKDKLQRDIKELKGRYEASLTQAEQQMKQVQTVQEELQKFKGDCEEFETWLQQAKGEMKELGAPAAGLDTLSNNLQRQKSFSEDVMSHKGDLRFITISGQKVLDAAKACDHSESDGLPMVDMSGTCAAVKERLDSAASRYKALHTQCNQLGNNLKDVVDKYKKYEDASGALVKWLNASEEESRRQQSEPIAGDPQTLQRQLEETKSLQGQTTSRQAAVDTLRKTADALISAEGDLLSHPGEIQETVDDIVERYDNLSKSVSDRNEKLQVTLTRSLSVQDGLDEMMSWMEKVEESVKETPKVPLDSSSIADALSKEAALEQDMSSRQSSIMAMKAKVKKFVESAEPAAAALLQTKMEGLSQRFTDASEQHKQQVAQMEELQDKVEQFEKTSEKVQQFVLKSSQALSETDGPGKTVAELSQLLQLRFCQMSNYLIKLYMHMYPMYCRKEEVSSCQKQLQEFKSAAGVLMKWLEETKEQVPVLQPNCSEQGLGTDLQKVNVSDGFNFSPLIHILYLPLELMLVQQNMSYINNDYEHLGELLKARSSELSALLKRVQGVHDQAESLRQLFEGGCQVVLGMYSHISGWEEVKGTMEIRKQHLEESSRMLELFQTTQPQLSLWLQEKELMMGVLGPLSVDPNMLNTQKQQVQILLKEFDSRKPQYEKLTEAATAIASASEQQDPAVEQVKEQLASVSQKWQALTGQLSQRHALIEQAVGKTTQFQELLQSLSKSATCLETELNNQQALSTQPDEVKKQIEATNAILAQLREEKKRLKEAESVCSELSAMVTEEYLRADLTKQLEGITKPFRQLEDKAGIVQLNSAFASSQQFHQTSKDFQAWLNQTLQEQCKPQPVSANAEKLKQSLKENSAVQKAISEHEEPYNTIIKEGEALLQSTEGAEKVALQGQLSALKSSWDDVKKSNAAQAEKLQGALQRALKYKEHSEKLSSWLQECEDREKNVKLSANSVEIEGSLSQLKAIQKDVDKHRGQVAMANTAADSLLEVVTSDGDSVREEKATIGKRVDKLTEDLTLKRESLENISQKLKEFNDLQKEAKGQLEAARKQLDSHSALGVQAYSNKNLTNMKAQHNSLEGVHNQIEHLKNLAKSLVVDASEVEGVTDLLLQADSLEKDHMSITKKVEDACSTLENKLQGIGQFQNSIREMFANFTDLDDEFDGMAPVGRGLDTLRDQQSTIKDFVARLQDLMTNTANGRDSCNKMLESEASPDLLGLKRDLETLGKQCGKLMDRATGRREQVEETLSHLEEFYVKAQEFTHKLSSAEKQEESQGSVGLETEVINQQLETFKIFQRDVIESLQSQLQELNTLGQALIQNAAKGTSTKKLDQDLEEVNTRWNTLNKKVAERSAQLHEALLHCGRFQDALESLLSWLTDTEELVANQKPPSAEFKVVKAQIQEQKLLQRLLDDRRATVELIKTEGRKVTDLADTVDKEKIARETECLGQRWEDLLKKAENRQKQLENILVVAQQFHETLVPLAEWLTATEKRLANSELIGTQTSKLEEQISQHKALEEEVLGRGKILYQAMSLGQSLRTVSCVDDKELVQAKLDNTHSSYIELQEHCRQKAELLRQALANAQLFGEDEVALMTWLDEVHSKLSEVSIQDYTTAVLAKQHAEQLALHEDIELRKQNIEQAILNGLELLKQTTGDEVVVIQGKLDGIKTRYSEINTMSNNVSKTLDKALSLATKLQNTHEELNAWLEKVESELAMFKAQEPVGEQLTCLQERQKTLMKEVKDQKPLVDSLNEVSSALLELVPWRAREGLDRMVTDDNERYRTASDAITQHVDQTGAAILKSQQFEQAATSELEWLTEAERKLSCLGDVRLEPEQTTAQLQAQKSFSMDIMRHKDAVDVIVKTGEAIINKKDEAEKQTLRVKLQALSEKYSVVSQLNSERCLQLERAHSLASQFWETYDELWPWLQETRTTFTQLSQPAIEYEALRQQQEELRQMREVIAEHKPHIDKMNKTGPQLLELSPTEGAPIREKYEAADKLYSQLKVDVKHRAAALDEAISKSTQFHDKIDPMLESLERIAERLRQPPSISVEVEKIREQISDNKAVNVDLEKLQPSYETLKQRGEEMIARSEGADKDLSAKAVQDKLDLMVFLWNDIQALLEEREAKLLDVMDLAEKFWCDHCALIVTIKDTHDLLKELEEPGVDPSVVKQQQESAEGFREEIDGLQEELNVVQNLGAELMTACGEPDKPVIKKSIDEVNSAWETLSKTWKERVETLEEAMQAAVQFQDSLQNMFDSVDIMEGKLDSMSPVGTDLETVKQQIEELKEFKGDAYQLQIEMERLNHQTGLLLKKVVEEADRTSILEPMNELKMLWDDLDKKIINRQHKLEGALLALGQFQHALDELVAWLTHTEELLSEQRKACGDPKAIEIELAKHHVLQNDVLAHKTTVEAVNKAGSDLIDSSAGEEARGLQNKLENLNKRWKTILEKTEQRRQLLDSALLQAQGFHGEIEDMQQWLKDSERQLLASKALGGLPDTAREQLNTHLELCSTLEAKEEIYKQLLDRGQQILAMTPEGQDSTTELDLRNLQEKWACVRAKVTERKVKLEEALAMATDFHNSLQDFINWLMQAEQTLAMASPASLILETIMFQIDEHKVFVTEVNSHRDQIIELDKTGTHLKYFSQKQDVVLIRNLLLSVQGRWEKVVQRSVERGRLLDDARKRAKQFHESWNKLMEWLEDKHSVYDTTSRTGRALKDKTSLLDDNQKLDDMLSELRDKWDTVCGKSVERQNKLEEALLFSGQFTDALQALIDWLYKVEPQLAEDQPVHGDIDLVLNLIDSHKVFQKELGKRTGSVQALKRSARELIEISHDDSSWVKVQMQELSTRWETVCSLSVSKQTRLEQALCQAEEFHSTVHILLEWLAEAEQSLRFHGALPDDEEALRALIEQHKEFMKKLEEKRQALNKATSLGEAILSICHPDSITTIKHWNTIIKARFEEVMAWARQHQQRLSSALAELLATQELLENLLNWLQWAETTLGEKDKDPLPQELEEVKTLIAEHQAFMEEMTRKQPDVDKITKTHKRKATADPPVQSQIPILEKGRTRSPTQSMYTAASQAQIETKNPRVNLLVSKWQQVWLLALDRRRKLNDALDRLEELKEFANFDFDVWRKRYMRWMNHKKSRVMDFFRRIDKDQDGKVTRQEFIDGILSSKFPTSRLEMSAVADIFDRDGDGYIDYYEFVAALHPNKDAYKPLTDADKIEDEVTRQVAKCKCPKRFQVEQIGANKYRFYLGNQFGDSQQLRLVRILRSTVMVRVGGGWMALDEFLVKNDPCRGNIHFMLYSTAAYAVQTAKGRTNVELREKFILPEGTTQVMASFRYRGRRSRPSSRGTSPNRSNSSHSCPAQPNPPGSNTPKTPQHVTRNYDKPWLTNSKSATPLKSSDSFDSQGSSNESTPIQGSKLRLPGYLSGKGFQSGEDGSLINAAVMKARGQAMGDKIPSRPGSKAGSRGSSRRGSDASDFDISDIQSVCSDVLETVTVTPRSASRQHGGKPSKIPTPQRRSTPTSKLAKTTKR